MLPMHSRRSTVLITKTIDLSNGDKKVAKEYVFSDENARLGKEGSSSFPLASGGKKVDDESVEKEGDQGLTSSPTSTIAAVGTFAHTTMNKKSSSATTVPAVKILTPPEYGLRLATVCEKNAQVANEYGRFDHERVWKLLKTVFGHESCSQKREGFTTLANRQAVQQRAIGSGGKVGGSLVVKKGTIFSMGKGANPGLGGAAARQLATARAKRKDENQDVLLGGEVGMKIVERL